MCCTSVSEYWDIFVQIIFMGIGEFVPKCVRTRHTANVSYILNMYVLCLAKRTVVGNGTDDLEPMLYTLSTGRCLCYAPKLLIITLLVLKIALLSMVSVLFG